jgi:O-antigen/teichoic acid export membrane protein
MQQGRTYNVIRNISSGLIYKLISIFLPFILRTVMIHYMGIQYAGLNTLFSSILQVLSMAELGFGSALTFSLYKPLVDNDEKKICELLNLYKIIYRRLGFIILGIGLVLVPFLKYLIKGTYPGDINIYILYYIYLFNTCISYFLFAYKQSLLNANQRNDIVNNVGMITYTVSYIFQILAILIFKNYYVYIIFTPICTVVNNILVAVCANRAYPNLQCRGSVTVQEKKEIYNKVKALAGHKIGGVVINSLDSVVVSAFLGLSTVALYGNYYYILSAINGIIDVGYNAILASVGNTIVIEEKQRVYTIFKKLNFIMSWAICFCCVGLICLYQPFMIVWVGKENIFPTSTMIIIVIYFYSQKSRLIGLNFKDAAGLWNLDFWKPYVGLIVNLVVNIVLVNIIGVNGVYISTILTMFGVYFPWETWALFKGVFKRESREYILQYLYYTIGTIISAALSFIVTNNINVTGILGLAIKAVVGILVGNVIYLCINLKNPEFKSIIVDLKRKMVR